MRAGLSEHFASHGENGSPHICEKHLMLGEKVELVILRAHSKTPKLGTK